MERGPAHGACPRLWTISGLPAIFSGIVKGRRNNSGFRSLGSFTLLVLEKYPVVVPSRNVAE